MLNSEVKFHIHGLFDCSLHDQSKSSTSSICFPERAATSSTALSTAEDAVPLLVSQTLDPKLISSLRQFKHPQHHFSREALVAQGPPNSILQCEPSRTDRRIACGATKKICSEQTDRPSCTFEAQVSPNRGTSPFEGEELGWLDGGAIQLQQLVDSSEIKHESARSCRGPGPKLFASVKGSRLLNRL